MECRFVPASEYENRCEIHDRSWTECMRAQIEELKSDKEKLQRRLDGELGRNQDLVQRNRQTTKIADAASGRTPDTRQPTGCVGAVEALIEEFNRLKMIELDAAMTRDALESLVAEQGMCNDLEKARGRCAGHPGLMRLPCPVANAREVLDTREAGKRLLARLLELDRMAAEFIKAKLELALLRATADVGMKWNALTAESSPDEAADVCGRLSKSLQTWHDWKKIP